MEEKKNKYRHELKFYINDMDCAEIRSRLKHLAYKDKNADENGEYKISSLYFDNYMDKAVVEKLAGASRREKFRLRYYGTDTSFIRLEKKAKFNRLCLKESVRVTKNECESIIANNWEFLTTAHEPLLWELYSKSKTQMLRPRTVVDYIREAYIYPAGNVRITIDKQVTQSSNVNDFLNKDLFTMPAANATILEVKFDEFLPEVIHRAVGIYSRGQNEFSKYVVARMI